MKGVPRLTEDRKVMKVDRIILFSLMVIHTLLLFWIADFPRKAISYPDEMLYYDIAKSIYSGRPFALHEVGYSFTNLAYPLLLTPLMGIRDTVLRVRLIALLHAVLMSLPSLAVWKIGTELRLRRLWRWIAVLILMVWPDLVNVGTFMSENLYWPLAAYALLLCLYSFTRKKVGWAAGAAVLSYACYFCREVGLCFALAYLTMQVGWPFLESFFGKEKVLQPRKPFLDWLRGVDWKSMIVFSAAFAVLYLGVNRGILGTVQNGYMATVQAGAVSSHYNTLYFIRSLVSYFITVSLAFLVLPVISPMVHYWKLNEETRKAYLFAMILLLGTIVAFCYTIGILEDLGKDRTRIHLRYFAPYFMMLLPAYCACLSRDEAMDRNVRRRDIGRTAAAAGMYTIALVGFLRTPLAGAVNEALGLGYLRRLGDLGGILTHGGDLQNAVVFDGGALLTCGLVALILGIGLFLAVRQKSRHFSCAFFVGVCLTVCVVNTFWGIQELRRHYAASEAVRDDMASLNNTFVARNLENSDVLFLCDDWLEEEARIYDLYFDAGREYVATRNSMKQAIGNVSGREIDLSSIALKETVFQMPFVPEKIDYIIEKASDESLMEMLQDVSLTEMETPEGRFRVYWNEENRNLLKQPDEDAASLLQEIRFTAEGYNADSYVVQGISGCEGFFSWTEGNALELEVPELKADQPLWVKVDTYDTFLGPRTYVVYQNGEEISRGQAAGDDSFEFHLMPAEGVCRFTIAFPDALSPASAGLSADNRVLSMALRSIRILEE